MGKHEFKSVLKSSISGPSLRGENARTFLGAYVGSKEVTIKIDVDPVVI